MRRLLFAAALTAALTGCPSGTKPVIKDWNQPAAKVTLTPPFAAPGERVRYRVTAYDVELAQMVLAVGEITDLEGRRAVVVQAEAQSTGLAGRVRPVTVELTSWLDVLTGQPLLFRAIESKGKEEVKREQDEVRFTQMTGTSLPIAVSHPDEPEVPEKIETQITNGQPLEMLGVLFALRAWEGKEGEQRTFEAVRSRYMWRLQVTVTTRETLPTELGELPTVKFEAVSRRLHRDGTLDQGTEPRKFSVWISDDADRVPLLLVAETDYGDIRMEIADYTAGTSPNLARP